MRPQRRLLSPSLLYFTADILAITAAYYSTFLLRFHTFTGAKLFAFLNASLDLRSIPAPPDADFEAFYIISAPRLIAFMCVTVCFLYAFLDLYAGRRFIRRRDAAWNVIRANVLALLLFYGYLYLSRNEFHPRSMFATTLALNSLYCMALRAAAVRVLRRLAAPGGEADCPVVLVGANRYADFLSDLVGMASPHGERIVERIPLDIENFDQALAHIARSVEQHQARMVICADDRLTVAQIMRMLEVSESLDVMTKILSNHLDVLPSKARIHVDTVYGIPLVHYEAASTIRRAAWLRRAYSFAMAAVLLIVFAPLLAAIAAVIYLSSGRPVFFTQERIGVDRRPFRIYKFRTMHNRAEELLATMEEFNESGTGLFKIRNDPRVTPVGRVLRRLSLDEWPQLLNVLRGEMIIVGPRPLPRRDFANYYEEWHYSRHEGMPGLTCLWQVSGRSDIDFHNMCILDVYYLRNASLILDLKIVLRTVVVVLFAKGAY